jgi:8-oxo-dGTP pyrophosphatase MutT (NUDIX family)
MNQQPRAIISAILTRKQNTKTEVFLQTRWKPEASPTYSGLLEIPAGGIDAYENVYDALRREVKEETNLEITNIVNDYQSQILEPRPHDKAFVFKPFLCQEVLETNGGLPWVGFVFLCEVKGEATLNPAEAKDPIWISISELEILIKDEPSRFFPLQLPVLEYFVNHAESK